MKRLICMFLMLFLMFPVLVEAKVIFSQDYSISTELSAYVSATPDSGQFNNFYVGTDNSWGISNSTLRLNRESSADNSIFNRFSDLAASPLTLFCCQMDVDFSFSGQTENKSLGYLQFLNTSAVYPYGSVTFLTGSSNNTWKVSGGAGSFAGMQTVKIYVNDTGYNSNYIDPLGSSRVLGSTYFDVWVGTNLVKSSVADGLNSANHINGFRFVSPKDNVTAAAMMFDSIIIETFTFSPVNTSADGEEVFSQDYSASTELSAYVSATPDAGQFNNFYVGTDNAWSISDGALDLNRGSSADNSIFNRFSDLAASPLTLFCCQMDVNFLFTDQTANKSLGYLQFLNTSAAYSYGSVTFLTDSSDNTWKVSGGTGSFTGTQTVAIYVNDTGFSTNYIDPLGVSRSIDDAVADIWVDTNLVRSAALDGLNTNNDINGFRFVSPKNSVTAANMIFDNITVRTLSEGGFVVFASVYGLSGVTTNDYDEDGLSDFGEYAFNGDPTDSDDTGVQPVFDALSGNYNFYLIGDDTISAHVLTNSDLVNGAWGTNTTLNVSAHNGVLSNYTDHVGTATDKMFIRLLISSGQ